MHAFAWLSPQFFFSFNLSILFSLLLLGASCVFFQTVFDGAGSSCPAGGHCVKQTEFVIQAKQKKNLEIRQEALIPTLPLAASHLPPPSPSGSCSFALQRSPSKASFYYYSYYFFNIFILSSLHPALKKNNITKFPNVYSRVRNSSSSSPVVVDVSQTWQASLFYLLLCHCPLTS